MAPLSSLTFDRNVRTEEPQLVLDAGLFSVSSKKLGSWLGSWLNPVPSHVDSRYSQLQEISGAGICVQMEWAGQQDATSTLWVLDMAGNVIDNFVFIKDSTNPNTRRSFFPYIDIKNKTLFVAYGYSL